MAFPTERRYRAGKSSSYVIRLVKDPGQGLQRFGGISGLRILPEENIYAPNG